MVNRKSSDAEKSLEIKSSRRAPLENPTPARDKWHRNVNDALSVSRHVSDDSYLLVVPRIPWRIK
jgi:hypothetical protein